MPHGRAGDFRARGSPDVNTPHLRAFPLIAFGSSMITPRWQVVLAGATPVAFGVPHLVDETPEPLDASHVARADDNFYPVRLADLAQAARRAGRRARQDAPGLRWPARCRPQRRRALLLPIVKGEVRSRK